MTKKTINDRDGELFRESVGAVRQVRTDKIDLISSRTKPKLKIKAPESDDPWLNSKNETDLVGPEETVRHKIPGLQDHVLQKLRKGYFPIQARLDLHGSTVNTAKLELQNFLQLARQNGFRCVLIIHGKGYGSTESYPILKNHLNQWLRNHVAIQAFCSAPQKEGGAGAFLVLLRQKNQG